MQDRTEIDRNPHGKSGGVELTDKLLDRLADDAERGFPVPEGENEAEPTRASSRPASKKKSTLTLTYEEVAKLKGVEFATELFALKEAASTYHPSPESIAAAMRAIRITGDPPSEALMRLAGPTIVTWLRDPKGTSRHNFSQWVRFGYPKDWEANKAVGGKSHGTIAPRPANAWGVYKRVPPELNAKFRAEGKRWCPNCAQPKPVAQFIYKTGNKASQCRDCRNRNHNTVKEETV